MSRGTAIVEGNVAYFMQYNGQTSSYDSSTQRWSELPKCPYVCGSLAIIGLLTVVGGAKGGATHRLLSMCTLSVTNKMKQWEEHFPPMLTK